MIIQRERENQINIEIRNIAASIQVDLKKAA